MQQTIKAFWVWWNHYPIIAIMPAENAGKAKYASLALIQDSYSDASIIEMSARRAPEFDALAQHAKTRKWSGSLGWHDLEECEAWGCLWHEQDKAAQMLNLENGDLLPSEWSYPRSFELQR